MKNAMLFGGALMCAGLHAATAEAQVSGVSFEFFANVSNQFAYDPDGPYTPSYVDTGINESFSVSGGTEVLPFSRGAIGGGPSAYGFLNQENVSVSGDGSLSASGAFDFSGSASASGSYLSEFDSFGASLSVEFTVDSDSPYELSASGEFDNDFGFATVTLRASDGTLVYSPGFDLFFNDTVTGTLAPDTYTLFVSGSTFGNASVDFAVVPAPATAGLFAAGLLASRRRR